MLYVESGLVFLMSVWWFGVVHGERGVVGVVIILIDTGGAAAGGYFR